MDGRQSKLYFDDACRVCAVAAGAAKNIASVELHGVAEGMASGLERGALMQEVHLVDADGTEYRGADAIVEILARNRYWKWLAAVLKMPGIRGLTRSAYRFVARHRHVLP